MTEANHAPDSLKYQWRLLALVTRSKWATGLDKSVALEIIDNYMKPIGNSRSSLSYLQQALGADRKAIIASTRRLVEHGPFSVVRLGEGTRPTEYKLHFDLVAENASSGLETTTNQTASSSGLETTIGSGAKTTTRAASSGLETTQTDLHLDGLQAGLNVSKDVSAAPASANAERAAGFEDAWKAYGKYGNKKASRAAWDAIANPDVNLIAEKAASWCASAKPDQKRMPFEKWLAAERYDEADRRVEASSKRLQDGPRTVDRTAEPVADNDDAEPFRVDTLTVINAFCGEETDDDGETSRWLNLEYRRREDGREDLGDSFAVESTNGSLLAKDKARMQTFFEQTGLGSPAEPEALVGKTFVRVLRSKFADWQYEPDWTPAPRKARLPPGPRLWERPLVAVPRDQPGTIDWSKYHDDDEDDEVEDAA